MRVCKKKAVVALAILAVLAAGGAGCGRSPELQGNKPPIIASLKAQYPVIDPQATSEVRCQALDPEGGELSFKWSSTGGTINGAGPAVDWQAPNSYGGYHIMVIVSDPQGTSSQAVLTVDVVARPGSSCCGR